MKVLFYSLNCEYCLKLLSFLDNNNIKNEFKLINIDKIDKIPKNIDIVPTIIDSNLIQPLKGKFAFEYINNLKYFNNSTNNYSLQHPPNPIIKEDDKAIYNENNNFEI
jgi:thiol-disulfide isomerase/thioredoxin